VARYAQPAIVGTLATSAAMNAFAFASRADGLMIYPAIGLGFAPPSLVYALAKTGAIKFFFRTGLAMIDAIEPEAELFALAEHVDLAEKTFHNALAHHNRAQIAYPTSHRQRDHRAASALMIADARSFGVVAGIRRRMSMPSLISIAAPPAVDL
jgi:hypothetical protein